MPNASLRHKIFVCLLLITVLAVPWASAAGRAAPAPDLFQRAWSFFMSLWNKSLPDEGCHIDPSGRCGKSLAAPPAPRLLPDTGCHIDPSGLCGAS